MENTENKNVTLADVRQALGETDPHQTNSSKLRAVLGRGSFATIQRHIETIRAEKVKAAQPLDAPVVPAMPDEFKALWAPVYATAVGYVRARLDAVVMERDGLALAVATAKADMAALESLIDEDERAAAEQAATIVRQDAAIAAHALNIAERDKQIEACKHALEMAERDHKLAMQASSTAMRQTIDSLTSQVVEMKTLLNDLTKSK